MSYRQRDGVQVSLHSFFTSKADGGVWLTPRKESDFHLYTRLFGGPKISLEE